MGSALGSGDDVEVWPVRSAASATCAVRALLSGLAAVQPGVTAESQGSASVAATAIIQTMCRMEAEAPKVKVTFKPSQKVRIVDGPFNDFIGTVAEIDMDRATVRVMVSFFGRDTPVALDFLQVAQV